MKKLIITLIILVGGFSPLFSMNAEAKLKALEKEIARQEAKKEFKKEHKEELQILKKRLKEAEAKAEGREETTQKQYEQDFKVYKAQEEARIAREGAERVLRIKNSSKWNAIVEYEQISLTGEPLSDKLGRRGESNDTLTLYNPDAYTKIVVYVDGKYWRDKFADDPKAKEDLTNVVDKVKRVIDLYPNKSVNVEVTIPKLPGGKFEGFAFNVKPLVTEGFTMTLKEYIDKRKAGDIIDPTDEQALAPLTLEKFFKDVTEAKGLSDAQKETLINKFMDNQDLSPEELRLFGEYVKL